MSKIATVGKRRLEGGVWHDDNGPIPDHPGDWEPPMTNDEIVAAALDDPDNPPTPPERLARMRRVSPAKFIRQKLGMSQDAFSAAYGIPLDTLQAWERHAVEPGPVELAYLRAIARAPEATRAPERVDS